MPDCVNFKTDELINKALKIMEKRACDEKRSPESRIAYNSAICMIIYALQDNEECLDQFDY